MGNTTVMPRSEFSKNNRWLRPLWQGRIQMGSPCELGILEIAGMHWLCTFLGPFISEWVLMLMMFWRLIRSEWFFGKFLFFPWCTSRQMDEGEKKSWLSCGFGVSGQKCKLFSLLMSLVVQGKGRSRSHAAKGEASSSFAVTLQSLHSANGKALGFLPLLHKMGWNYPPYITGETTSKEGASVHCMSSQWLTLIRFFIIILFYTVDSHLTELCCSRLPVLSWWEPGLCICLSLLSHEASPLCCIQMRLGSRLRGSQKEIRRNHGSPGVKVWREKKKKIKKIPGSQFAEDWRKAVVPLCQCLWFYCQPHGV